MSEANISEDKLRLVTAAREKFLESGFSKVTVDEIASELGMSKKTVYKFFPTKEDLLRGVLRGIMLYMENRLEKIVSSDDPFETKLANILMLIGGIVKKMRPQFMMDMRRSAPRLWEEVETFRREHMLPKVKKVFQQAKAEGVLKSDVDVDLFFLTFFHAVQGIVTPQTLIDHSFSADEAFRGVFRILFLGVLSPSSGAKYHKVEEILVQTSTSRSV